MKEPYMKDPASHHNPESCAGLREEMGEALTGESAGRAMELRKHQFRGPILLVEGEGNTRVRVMASGPSPQRSRRTMACVDTPWARTGRSQEFPYPVRDGTAEEGDDPNAQRERFWEVRHRHSTDEGVEQRSGLGLRRCWREGR